MTLILIQCTLDKLEIVLEYIWFAAIFNSSALEATQNVHNANLYVSEKLE